MSIIINYYDSSLTRIVRTRTYRTQALASAAINRAHKRGVCAAYAGTRTANDPPTAHH